VESVENSKNPSEFSTLSTGLGNPAKGGRISTFPPRRRRFSLNRRKKDEADTEFHLTDPGHFEHDDSTSVASLRS